MGLFKKQKNEAETFTPSDSSDNSVQGQLKKIADHLVFLEKKIDSILEQSRNQQQRRPFGQRFGNSSGNYRPGPTAYNPRGGNRYGHSQGSYGNARPHGSQARQGGHQSYNSQSGQGGFQKKFPSHGNV
jgi:hypothetical protein